MPSRESVYYFGAGPAPLPTAVLEKAGDALLNYNNLGVGICEMSHRSADATAVLTHTKAALSELLDIPTDEYEIIFSQGGGTGQFSAAVYHTVSVWVSRRKAAIEKQLGSDSTEEAVLAELKKAVDQELTVDYLVTGSWSLKASQEAARLLGNKHVNLAADSRKIEGCNGKFGDIPSESEWSLTKNAAMVYYCDNETVDGVEFPSFPARLADTEQENRVPVVCDMSSNYISRAVETRNYDVIFGGAQKNIGVAGITIIIVKKSFLAEQTATPELLRQLGLPIPPVTYDWVIAAKNNSLYNTLPIFDVWIAGEVMRALIQAHNENGVAGQEKVVKTKSETIYKVLEKHPSVFRVVPKSSVRSRMNICFRILADDVPAAEKRFVSGAEELGLTGLKGHRSVGGMRISNYNAVPIEAIEKLAKYLDDFAQSC